MADFPSICSLAPFNLISFYHLKLSKYTMRRFFTRKRFRFIDFRFLISLLVLFSLNVSRSEAQGISFQPEEGGIPAGISVEVDSINPQVLRQDNDLSQVSGTNWSEPFLLFEENGTGEIHKPFVVSDSYGNVHVFWSVISPGVNGIDLIFYARLDAKGWTTPVDVVAASPARAPRATVGPDDYIYLTWNGSGGGYYSTVPITSADTVNDWSEPILLANSNIHASIITAPSGAVHLAYPGNNQPGIFEQVLEPNSVDWSSPRTISLNSLINTSADWVQITASDDGRLHVVWTEFYSPDHWPPRGVFYTGSTDGGYGWSAPMLLAGDGFDQINVVAQDDNNIHVFWNGQAGVGGRYHRQSPDGGRTWSETLEIVPAGTGGTEGPPQVVVDQAGTIHLITTYGGCTWYTYLKDQLWGPSVCISGEEALASNYIEEPSMTISEGNKLHVVFWDDRRRLWYTTKETEALWLPPKELENISAQPDQTLLPLSTSAIMPTTDPTGIPLNEQLDDIPERSIDTGQILAISLFPVVLLVVLIAALKFNKRI